MDKVWVVFEWDSVENETLLGIFSTEEKAKRYVEDLNARREREDPAVRKMWSQCIEEWKIDEFEVNQ
jgi:hypothetical protein